LLVHVGAAIGIINEEEAKSTMMVLKQMGEEI
jgi:hydrogenase expression/formation protein HypC